MSTYDGRDVSEQWRAHYDRWKLEAPDVQLTAEEQAERDAWAEDVATERAERAREDASFDRRRGLGSGDLPGLGVE